MPDTTFSNGSELYWSTDGVIYTAFADLKSMSPPGTLQRPDVDNTPLKPTNNTRSSKRGLRRNGKFSFVQFWSKTRETTMATLEAAAADLYFRALYPDGVTKREFRGYIADYHPDGFDDPEKDIVLMVDVTVTTFPTYTAAP